MLVDPIHWITVDDAVCTGRPIVPCANAAKSWSDLSD